MNINSPSHIGLKKDVNGKDLHSSKISENKVGLLKGARYKKDQGIISDAEFREIKMMLKQATIEYFRPFIYVISLDKVSHLLQPVSIKYKASLFSDEFIITELPGNWFDVIEMEGV